MNPTFSAFAPGRVEILGNHTDYNEGFVLAAAIDRGVNASITRLALPEIRLFSKGFGDVVSVPGAFREPLKGDARWANYPLGVIREFRERGGLGGGLDCIFESTQPIGAGLSSSAAIELATACALQSLLGTTLAPMDLALLCKTAENQFVGVNCGLLDQATSAFGKEDSLVTLDCRSNEVDLLPLSADFRLLVANSGVTHALTGGEYNARREQCHSAARKLGVQALRDITPLQLEEHAHLLTQLELARARHITGENARVLLACDAMRAGNPAALGPLMFDSHESSRVNFENSTQELDLLVELSRVIPGILGSRLTGGGFGGATVSLVDTNQADAAATTLAAEYRERTGIRSEVFLLRPGRGACA